MENITLFSHYWVGKSQLRAKQIESMPLFAYFLLLNHNGERSEPKIFRKWLSLLTECFVVESVRAERAEKFGNMPFFYFVVESQAENFQKMLSLLTEYFVENMTTTSEAGRNF